MDTPEKLLKKRLYTIEAICKGILTALRKKTDAYERTEVIRFLSRGATAEALEFVKSKELTPLMTAVFDLNFTGIKKHADENILSYIENLLTDEDENQKLYLLTQVIKYTKYFDITLQFWTEQNTVYISKGGVDLFDWGGGVTQQDVLEKALEYLERIKPNI